MTQPSSNISTVLSPVMQDITLIFLLGQSIDLIRVACERMKEGTELLHDDAATLFLLANGFERYLKVSLVVLHKKKNGNRLTRKELLNYGHKLQKMTEDVFALEDPNDRQSLTEKSDLAFAKSDPVLKALFECLDHFAGLQRYWLLDGAVGHPVDPELNPNNLWETVLDEAADHTTDRSRELIASRLITTINRFARSIYHTAGKNPPTTDMGRFCIRDDELMNPIRR